MNMRKFYLITTTVMSIFLSIAGIVLILNINAVDAGIELYAVKSSYIDEYKPEDSLQLYVGGNIVHASDEFNILAGKESIRNIITNFSNKNIMLIISFLRRQIEPQNYTDISMEDESIQFIQKGD